MSDEYALGETRTSAVKNSESQIITEKKKSPAP